MTALNGVKHCILTVNTVALNVITAQDIQPLFRVEDLSDFSFAVIQFQSLLDSNDLFFSENDFFIEDGRRFAQEKLIER